MKKPTYLKAMFQEYALTLQLLLSRHVGAILSNAGIDTSVMIDVAAMMATISKQNKAISRTASLLLVITLGALSQTTNAQTIYGSNLDHYVINRDGTNVHTTLELKGGWSDHWKIRYPYRSSDNSWSYLNFFHSDYPNNWVRLVSNGSIYWDFANIHGTKLEFWDGYTQGIDPSTMYFRIPGANQHFRFKAGSSDKMTLSGSGNLWVASQVETPRILVTESLGIGTTNPSQKLHVEGNIYMKNNQSFMSNGIINFQADNNDNGNGVFNFKAGNDVRMKLTDAGNLGIGTTNPSQKLHVEGNIFMKHNQSFMSNGIINFQADNNNTDDGVFNFKAGNDVRMTLTDGGNLGIGTTNPQAKLDIASNPIGLMLRSGNGAFSHTSNQIVFTWNGSSYYGHSIKSRHHSDQDQNNSLDFYLWSKSSGDTPSAIGSKHAMSISGNGNLGVGYKDPITKLQVSGLAYVGLDAPTPNQVSELNTDGYLLAVDGKIKAHELVVSHQNWPDYVFKDGYLLPTIKEVAAYIHENGHLPGVPSASEVQSAGLAVAEANRLLMEKLEEHTLYIIELEKKIDNLQFLHAEMESLRAQLEAFK